MIMKLHPVFCTALLLAGCGGGETITIGPAFGAHDFTDRMGGAYPLSDKHYTLYFTAYTPVEKVIRIRAKGKDKHL